MIAAIATNLNQEAAMIFLAVLSVLLLSLYQRESVVLNANSVMFGNVVDDRIVQALVTV